MTPQERVVARLLSKIGRQRKEVAGYTKTNVKLLSERDKLADQLKAKDVALLRFGQHIGICAVHDVSKQMKYRVCDCGLAEALKGE